MTFRGTYREVEPPTRTVPTWQYDGWPDADAVESVELHEAHGTTTMTCTLAFSDKAGRDHMTRFDGVMESFDRTENLLRSLLDQEMELSPGNRGSGRRTLTSRLRRSSTEPRRQRRYFVRRSCRPRRRPSTSRPCHCPGRRRRRRRRRGEHRDAGGRVTGVPHEVCSGRACREEDDVPRLELLLAAGMPQGRRARDDEEPFLVRVLEVVRADRLSGGSS